MARAHLAACESLFAFDQFVPRYCFECFLLYLLFVIVGKLARACGKRSGFGWVVGKRARVPGGKYKYLY